LSPQKKARLRKARRLLIVPFKTKILQYNIFIEVTVYPGQTRKKHCYHDNQMNTGLPEIRNSGVDDWYGNIIFIKSTYLEREQNTSSPGAKTWSYMFRCCTDKIKVEDWK
jgi:hypothetical protein